MRRYRKTLLAVTAAVALIASGGYAAAETILGPATATTVDQKLIVQLAPKKAPKNKWTPGTMRVRTEARFPASEPRAPITDSVKVWLDKNIKVNTKGLPTCQEGALENTNAKDARKECPKAIIGVGKANAWVAMPDSAKIPAPAPVTIFNGVPKKRKPVYLIHAYTTVPLPTTFVVPGVFMPKKGKFGYELNFKVPEIAGGYGSLDFFDATTGVGLNKKLRSWKYKGKKQFYGYGRCRGGKFTLKAFFHYRTTTVEDLPGPELDRQATATSKCKG